MIEIETGNNKSVINLETGLPINPISVPIIVVKDEDRGLFSKWWVFATFVLVCLVLIPSIVASSHKK